LGLLIEEQMNRSKNFVAKLNLSTIEGAKALEALRTAIRLINKASNAKQRVCVSPSLTARGLHNVYVYNRNQVVQAVKKAEPVKTVLAPMAPWPFTDTKVVNSPWPFNSLSNNL